MSPSPYSDNPYIRVAQMFDELKALDALIARLEVPFDERPESDKEREE